MSCLEVLPGFFRLPLKVKFDGYVLWRFEKGLFPDDNKHAILLATLQYFTIYITC